MAGGLRAIISARLFRNSRRRAECRPAPPPAHRCGAIRPHRACHCRRTGRPEPEVALNGLPVGSPRQLGGAVGVPSRHRCRTVASSSVPDVRDRVDDAAEYFLERQTRARNLCSHGGAASVFSFARIQKSATGKFHSGVRPETDQHRTDCAAQQWAARPQQRS
jgi:hypothetical protein